MSYTGHYINLDRNPERCLETEGELAHYGLKDIYSRFPASDGNSLGLSNPHLKAGEMGCFTSHYLLLKENVGNSRALHIIEDDAVFSPATEKTLLWLTGQEVFDSYDIVYTDVIVPLLNDAYKAYKKFYDTAVRRDATGNISSVAFSVVDLKGLLFGSTSSYMVNPKSIKKLYEFYAQEIANEPRQSNDLFIRRLCNENKLRVGCLFPFVTSVRLDRIVDTEIERGYHEMSALAAHIARYSFFIGADFGKCREYLEKCILLPPSGDEHARILSHLLAYSLTDSYQAF